MQQLKKIVAIGPESTGKSSLCEQLARHYNTNWVPEYAREYLLKNGTDYNYQDVLKMAKGQIEGEDSITANTTQTPLLFIDTDLYVIKVWGEFMFNQCDNSILNGIVSRKYDLYLLCKPDVPWVKDELREYPDLVTREKLYHHYKELVTEQKVPWIEVSGNYEERFQKAIKAVDKLLD